MRGCTLAKEATIDRRRRRLLVGQHVWMRGPPLGAVPSDWGNTPIVIGIKEVPGNNPPSI